MKLSQKRIRRHLLLALLVLVVVSLLFVGFGQSKELWVDEPTLKAKSLSWRLSMSFAYVSIAFLITTLAIGPFNVLQKKPNPTNTPKTGEAVTKCHSFTIYDTKRRTMAIPSPFKEMN